MNLTTRGKLKAMLAGAMGGRAAEELVFGEITNGASGDISQITDIARTMVTRWGMSEKLGPMTFGKKEELVFLGKELGEQRDYSDSVAQEIDAEVRHLVQEAHEAALKTLREHRDILDRVAQKLIEVETLDMDAFEAVYNGQEPPTESPSGPAPTPPRPARPAYRIAERARPHAAPPSTPRPRIPRTHKGWTDPGAIGSVMQRN
jgi:cell division protease FtsH